MTDDHHDRESIGQPSPALRASARQPGEGGRAEARRARRASHTRRRWTDAC